MMKAIYKFPKLGIRIRVNLRLQMEEGIFNILNKLNKYYRMFTKKWFLFYALNAYTSSCLFITKIAGQNTNMDIDKYISWINKIESP